MIMTANTEAARPANVLLVEDNDADIALTRVLFEHEGVEVALHTVLDGEQALAFLRRRPPYETAPCPDLILMDLSLPGLDGRSVIAEIQRRADWASIPIIVLSGLDLHAPQADPPPPGVQAYINKPIHYEDLRGVVDNLPGLAFETAGGRHYLYARPGD
jgi:two-component system response regulator